MEADNSKPADREELKHKLRTVVRHVIGYAELLLESDEIASNYREDLVRIDESVRNLELMMESFFVELPLRDADSIYSLLHDLRTPVNHIVGYTEIILEELGNGGNGDATLADLQKIRENMQTWMELVEQYTGAPVRVRRDRPLDKGGSQTAGRSQHLDPNSPAWIFAGVEGVELRPTLPGHILIVDDDRQNRDILERRLRQLGHLVDCLSSGEEAFEWLTNFTPDLVLLDMLMPGLSGRDVLSAMKSIGHLSDIPVIVISALDDQAQIAECIGLGAEDYLSTPFNPAVLKARISSSLEKRRLRKAEVEHLLRLEEEKQKSERLLLNILPASVADRLRAGETNIADYCPDVTVIFADLVNFTGFASQREPEEVLGMLNRVFSLVDLIAQKHGLEKIKTIGDAYMAVAGLPAPMENHAHAAARFALDLSQEIKRMANPEEIPLALRVGIDTGPVIAGIIGRDKFIYDLWGDTVNIASRMESHGLTGQIQVSENTWERLKDSFQFTERGSIDIKGKGQMKAWILDS